MDQCQDHTGFLSCCHLDYLFYQVQSHTSSFHQEHHQASSSETDHLQELKIFLMLMDLLVHNQLRPGVDQTWLHQEEASPCQEHDHQPDQEHQSPCDQEVCPCQT